MNNNMIKDKDGKEIKIGSIVKMRSEDIEDGKNGVFQAFSRISDFL